MCLSFLDCVFQFGVNLSRVRCEVVQLWGDVGTVDRGGSAVGRWLIESAYPFCNSQTIRGGDGVSLQRRALAKKCDHVRQHFPYERFKATFAPLLLEQLEQLELNADPAERPRDLPRGARINGMKLRQSLN